MKSRREVKKKGKSKMNEINVKSSSSRYRVTVTYFFNDDGFEALATITQPAVCLVNSGWNVLFKSFPEP